MRADFTPSQIRVLWALDRYRLLNVGQMRRLGVGRDRATLAGNVQALQRRHMVAGTEHRPLAGFDHLPALYWLTEAGATRLGALFPDQPAPIGARRKMKTAAHVKHRMMQVEAHIALRLWASAAGVNVGWFVTDFERGSRDRKRATTIVYSGGSFTPDALAEIAGPDGASRLLVIEIERGTEHEHLTAFLHEKLPMLRAVAEGGLVNTALKIKPQLRRPERFLVVFQSAAMRDRAQRRWPDPDARVWGQFFVKAFDELADFNGGWWRPGGDDRRPLFSWATAPQGAGNKAPACR